MSIQKIEKKTGTVYRICVFAGKTLDGKQIRYTDTFRPEPGTPAKKAYKQAVQMEKELEEKIKVGFSPNAKLLFYDYAADEIKRREDREELKPATVHSYTDMNEMLKDQIGYLPLDQITPGRLTVLYDWLAQPGRNRRNGGKLSNKTIREYHMFISSIMSRAEKEGRIMFNPCKKADPPKKERHRVEILQPEEVERMLKLLESEPLKWRAYIHLLLTSGARRGEIAGLKWDKVDFFNNQIEITNNLLYDSTHGVYETTPKTEDSVRFIKLPAETMEMLKTWRKQCNLYRKANEEIWNDTDFVFIQENGNPIHPQSVSRWFERFCERNSFPKISIHKLRHTAASILIDSGVSIATVSKRLGHSQISTTLNVYTHQIKKRDEAAAETIADAIYSATREKQVNKDNKNNNIR